MKLKDRVFYSIIFSLIFCSLIFLFPLLPCHIKSNLPNASFEWGSCQLGSAEELGSTNTLFYYGVTRKTNTAYFISILSSFLFAFILLSLFFRKKNKKEQR